MEGWRVSGRDQGAGDRVRGASDMPKGPHGPRSIGCFTSACGVVQSGAGAVAGVPRGIHTPRKSQREIVRPELT